MSQPLRVLIADDEKMARKRLRRLLETAGGVTIVSEARSGEEAAAALDPESIDAAILDIDMPDLDGLQLAELAGRRGIPVIFVTAHEQHAVKAFATGATHYLLKPLALPELDAALARVRDRASPRTPERIALTVGDDVHLVPTASISHAVFDGTLVTVHAEGREWLSSDSLQDLERKLAGGDFLRVHRRALVQLAHVERLEPLPSGGYNAVLSSGAEVPVSRQVARELRRRLL
ncbi:MAG: response regulator transcription factor [Deltaproteobacteria bacterium]|nr:response regulator transcription factor [Deltaproteobacteria bacterium]